jgi:hypothetical protein
LKHQKLLAGDDRVPLKVRLRIVTSWFITSFPLERIAP